MSMSITQYKKSLSWSRFLYLLARQVAKNNIPETFLTTEELECLNQALSSAEQWESFFKGDNSTTQLLSLEQIAAFRVRAMLSEQLIQPCLNQHYMNTPCCQSSSLIIAELDQLSDLDNNGNESTMNSPIPFLQENTVETETKTFSSSHVPLLDIYHTLEFDRDAMIEQRKLEAHQEQEELQEKPDNSTSAPLFLRSSDQFELKFLLKGIAENRDKTSLSDRELRHLLSEVNPNKSKWANEERVGQEELYEACEKVLIDLKNYTEHSTPFLTKVSRRDAPDYYEVIKEPMDLGTVTKKLKNAQYNSKQQFARDLYLIYDNCLEYNTEPTSEYRKHANAMRRKTDRLLSRVPDIEIKERPEYDLDESDDDHIERRDTPQPDKVVRERSVTYDSIHDDTTTESPVTQQYSGKKMPSTSSQDPHLTETENIDPELDIHKGELQNQLWRDITSKTRAKLTTDVEKQYQFEFSNRQAITHSSLNMTRLYLMEYLHHQPKAINRLIRCSSTAFVRWFERTEWRRNASLYDAFDLDSEDEEDYNSSTFFFSKNHHEQNRPTTDEDDALRDDLFLPEYLTTPNIPKIQGVPEILHDQEELLYDEIEEESSIVNKRERPSLDIYPSTRPLSYGLNMYIDKNIKTLDDIRSMHKKCHNIRLNVPISLPPYVSDSPLTTNSPLSEGTSTPIPTAYPPLNDEIQVNKEAADQMMQRSLIQLLNHAGFETAHAQPMNILHEIMSQLFLNMGRTIRRYCDEYRHQMTDEEILLHTLQENGVSSIMDLEHYVTEDIQAYGDTLVEIKQDLENEFQKLAKQSSEDSTPEISPEESLIDDEDSFAIANLCDNVIDDFFGLKELGIIDKECKNITVPVHLCYSAQDEKAKKTLLKQRDHKYPIPPRFQPITDIHSFIGLLQPWYHARLSNNEGKTIIEDEFIQKRKDRPRYPAVTPRSTNSKLFLMKKPMSNKRVLKDGSNIIHHDIPAKRKKTVMDEATKAERKKQRLELKAQKKQEEKKKQREELKTKKLTELNEIERLAPLE